jgi:hypothetical protein
MMTTECIPPDFQPREEPSELDAAIERFNAICDATLERIEQFNNFLRDEKAKLEGAQHENL